MIYIIRAEGTNYYKIGSTKDVGKRLKGLQTGCPNKLSLITSFNGNYEHEKRIQEHLKKYKTRENGEWFELTFGLLVEKLSERIVNSYIDREVIIEIPKKIKIHLRAKGKSISKEEYNEMQREWYKWRKRAKAVGVEPLKSRRPTPGERKEWRKEILELEHLGEKNGTSK